MRWTEIIRNDKNSNLLTVTFMVRQFLKWNWFNFRNFRNLKCSQNSISSNEVVRFPKTEQQCIGNQKPFSLKYHKVLQFWGTDTPAKRIVCFAVVFGSKFVASTSKFLPFYVFEGQPCIYENVIVDIVKRLKQISVYCVYLISTCEGAVNVLNRGYQINEN